MNGEIVVLSTCAHAAEADAIAEALVRESLAACVQVIPNITSTYRWQGKVEKTAEHLLIIKTTSPLFEAIAKRITELHSYEIPEIVALPITAGSAPYLAWLGSNVIV